MVGRWLALLLDESKWLTIAMGVAFSTVARQLYRHRRAGLASDVLVLGATTLLFAVTISIMTFGHLFAVTFRSVHGTLVGPPVVLYAIGIALAFPSWWLLVHTLRNFGRIQSRTTLALNGSLAFTLVALGLSNLPLAVPGFLNVAFQLSRQRRVRWAIAGVALVVTAALFVGSLIFWASGQTFEQFRGMRNPSQTP